MKKHIAVLLFTWISWFWSHGSRVGISAVTPFLRQKYAMTTAEAAAVPGIFNLGFYLFALIAGRVPARIGFKNTVSIAALGSSAMILVAGVVDNRILLYGLVFAAGLFLSLHLPAAIPWLGSLFKGGRQGLYIGVHESGAPAGQTFGPIFLGLLFASVGVTWSLTLWALIPLLAGVGVIAVFIGDRAAQKVSWGRQASSWLGPGFYGLTLITVANLVGNLGVVAIVPLHLVDTFHLDKAFVATLVGVSRFVGVFGQPVGGYLHDRYGFFRVAAVLTTLNFFSSFYLMVAPYNFFYAVAMTVQAFVTAMYFPLIYSYLVKLQGPNASQYLGKMIFIAGLTGPTVAPIVAGFLAERFGYTTALIYPTAVAFAGMLQIISMSRKHAESSVYI